MRSIANTWSWADSGRRGWLVSGALCLLLATKGLAQEVTAEAGDLVLRPGSNGDVRVNDEIVATRPGLSRTDLFLDGLAGQLLGPDVEVAVQLIGKDGDSLYSSIITVARAGLSKMPSQTIGRQFVPYGDFVDFMVTSMAAQTFCRTSETMTLSLEPIGGDIRTVHLRLADPDAAETGECVDGIQVIKDTVDSVMYGANQLGGLLGLVLRTGAEGRNDLKTAQDQINEGLNIDVMALKEGLQSTTAALTAKMTLLHGQSISAIGAVEEALLADIKSLSAHVTGLNSDFDATLALQAKAAKCYAQGLLYNQTVDICVLAKKVLCVDRPTTAAAFTVVKGSATPATCPSNTLTPNSPEECAFECDSGYLPNTGGAQTYTCNTEGQWQSVGTLSLKCTPRDCGTLKAAAGLVYACSDTVFGGAGCMVKCADGYIAGSGQAVCQADGTWSQPLTCNPKSCSQAIPNLPDFAVADCTAARRFGDSCTASCTGAYIGSSAYTCDTNGSWVAKAPFICLKNALQVAMNVPDIANGCPADRAVKTKLIEKTFTLDHPVVVWITGHMIRNDQFRKDLELYVDGGAFKDRTLTYTRLLDWTDAHVYWTGLLDIGEHSVYLQSPNGDRWGCRRDWGDLDIFYMAADHVKAYQVNDHSKGCPDFTKPANAHLLEKQFETTSKSSLVIATGHMIRTVAGRADLVMWHNSQEIGRTLTWSDTAAGVQWVDANINTFITVPSGTHTIHLSSPQAGIWGCEHEWGDLNLMVIDDPSLFSLVRATDRRSGCPVAWPATTPLLAVEFEIKSEDTAIMVQGNMIALSTARSDLYLRVGGIVRDRSLTHRIESRQWQDLHVFWTGKLAPGKYTADLMGNVDNTYGCRWQHGKISVALIGS